MSIVTLLRKPRGTNLEMSERIAAHFPDGYRGYAVDVGASDGISVNSTYSLEHKFRWFVLSVEANPDFKPWLKETRSWFEICACGDKNGEATFHANQENLEALSSLSPANRPELIAEEAPNNIWNHFTVQVRTVDSLLEKWQFPQLDALCVDTEGTELDVLKGCDINRWKPRVIVTECWDETSPIDDYLDDKGYRKFSRFGVNDIFVRRGK